MVPQAVTSLGFQNRWCHYLRVLSQDGKFKASYIHAVSDYKKRLYKKQLVEFKETKKRRLVTIYQAKKRNSKKRL